VNANPLTGPGTSLGSRLQNARERTGITSAALAEALGVNVKSIRAWENDQRTPRANKLVNIAGVLGVSVRWLLEGQAEILQNEPEPFSLDELRVEIKHLRSHLTRAQTRLNVIASILAKPSPG
jgi:transcriptional regulator with XRE-family HTH domain